MKKITLTFLIGLIGAISIFAQSPQAFKYQTVIRDSSGNLIIDELVSFKIGIIKDSINGTLIYSETHSESTNQFGLVDLEIGTGTIEYGVFDDISWGTSSHYLKVEFDETGNTNYQLVGISQLLSVPYSQNSNSLTLTSPSGNTYTVSVNDNGNLFTNCFPPPTNADAGQNQLNVSSPTVLNANFSSNETCQWSIIQGVGGTLADPSNPYSEFTGNNTEAYKLHWTITNSCGSSTDDVIITFNSGVSCPSTVVDIDGNAYSVINVGTQCWMSENLKTTHYQDGTAILNETDPPNWQNLTTGAYVWYDNDIAWKDSYGALYNWFAVTDNHGLCPAGWHVPSADEWTTFTDYIGGTSSPHGNELKSCRMVDSPLGGDCSTSEHPRWDEVYNNHYGTDEYNFSGLPAGERNEIGEFYGLGFSCIWWTTTEYGGTYGRIRKIDRLNGSILYSYLETKPNGFSVRCVKD